ncbi:hypothetical protein TrVE_jg3765, partial [Triparma verrucosa]
FHYLDLAAINYAAGGQYAYSTPQEARAAHLSSTKRAMAHTIVCTVIDLFLNAMTNIGINRGHAQQIAARKKALLAHNNKQAARPQFNPQHDKDERVQHGNANVAKDDPPTEANADQPLIRHFFTPTKTGVPEQSPTTPTPTRQQPQPTPAPQQQPHAWTRIPTAKARNKVNGTLLLVRDGDTVFDIGGSNTFTAKHLRSLTSGKGWLADSIINPTLTLLTADHPRIETLSSLLPHQDKEKRSAYISKHRNALRSASTIIIPAHIQDSHWALFIIDRPSGGLTYLDGLNPSPPASLLHLIAGMLAPILDDVEINQTSPQLLTQTDSSSCGPLLLTAAAQWIDGRRPFPTQQDMPNARINIAAFLLAAHDEAHPTSALPSPTAAISFSAPTFTALAYTITPYAPALSSSTLALPSSNKPLHESHQHSSHHHHQEDRPPANANDLPPLQSPLSPHQKLTRRAYPPTRKRPGHGFVPKQHIAPILECVHLPAPRAHDAFDRTRTNTANGRTRPDRLSGSRAATQSRPQHRRSAPTPTTPPLILPPTP